MNCKWLHFCKDYKTNTHHSSSCAKDFHVSAVSASIVSVHTVIYTVVHVSHQRVPTCAVHQLVEAYQGRGAFTLQRDRTEFAGSCTMTTITVQQKKTIVSYTKTCITSWQHVSFNLPCNISESYIPVTEICKWCHHKPFPHGRYTAKLHNWIGTSYIADPDPVDGGSSQT